MSLFSWLWPARENTADPVPAPAPDMVPVQPTMPPVAVARIKEEEALPILQPLEIEPPIAPPAPTPEQPSELSPLNVMPKVQDQPGVEAVSGTAAPEHV